jgi:hypothetical protein
MCRVTGSTSGIGSCVSASPASSRTKLTARCPDDPDSVHGHPIALQVVGRKLEEAKTLAGMKIIEETVRVKDSA